MSHFPNLNIIIMRSKILFKSIVIRQFNPKEIYPNPSLDTLTLIVNELEWLHHRFSGETGIKLISCILLLGIISIVRKNWVAFLFWILARWTWPKWLNLGGEYSNNKICGVWRCKRDMDPWRVIRMTHRSHICPTHGRVSPRALKSWLRVWTGQVMLRYSGIFVER